MKYSLKKPIYKTSNAFRHECLTTRDIRLINSSKKYCIVLAIIIRSLPEGYAYYSSILNFVSFIIYHFFYIIINY